MSAPVFAPTRCVCGCMEYDHHIHPDTGQLIDCRACPCRAFCDVHAWRIDEPDGPVSNGRCKKCGAREPAARRGEGGMKLDSFCKCGGGLEGRVPDWAAAKVIAAFWEAHNSPFCGATDRSTARKAMRKAEKGQLEASR